MSAQFPEDDLSRFLPEGRNLRDLPAELVEEQKSIIFSPGKIIAARFEIQEEIGFGGIGAVYRVKDRLLYGHACALKVILPSLVRSYEAREHFLSEANRARELRHEGCVIVYDLGEDKEEDILFLSMELLEGSNLADHLKSREGTISFDESYDIIRQICDVLRYTHSRGIVHGGIKPQNIFILPDGKVNLLDFGLSRLLGPGKLTRFSIGFGIDCYMAPEQSTGTGVDVRADIFALGVVFYHMFIMQDKMSESRWPAGIEGIIKNCLKPQPDERYQDIVTLTQDIERVKSELTCETREDEGGTIVEDLQEAERAIIVRKSPDFSSSRQEGGQRKNKKLTSSLIAVFLIVLSAGLFMYITQKKQQFSPPAPPETGMSEQELSQKPVVPQIEEGVSDETERSGSEDETGQPGLIDPDLTEDVEWLLAQAQKQFQARRYTSPVRDNAFLTLKEVVARDPDNTQAREMIENMRDIYMAKGNDALKNREYLIAATYYEKALYVDPAYPPAQKGLEESNDLLRPIVPQGTAQTPDDMKDREIGSLLAKAEEQFRAQKLTYPRDGNAFLTAQEILRVEPGNEQALHMIEKIRDEYMRLGDDAFKKRNFRKAKMFFGKALSVYPGFSPAQTMLSEAEERRQESAQESDIGMVLIKGGCYQMGDAFGDGYSDERPVHAVCIDSFFIDRHEVTQKSFADRMASNPSSFSGDTLPADSVTWFEAREYCEKTGGRLPTEAEWEYAARNMGKEEQWAGTTSEVLLDDFAWFDMNSQGMTHPVGLKKSNAVGLYDMSGGVYEWVADRYDSDYYQTSPEKNPGGPEKGSYRVLRGGSWNSSPLYLRTTVRFRAKPESRSNNNGFRCARDSS